MIRSEFHKLFQRGSTILLLTLLFLANAFSVWNLPLPGSEPYSGIGAQHIRSLYAALPDDPGQALAALEHQYALLLDTEVDEALLTGDIYIERKLFRTVIGRVEPAANYTELLAEIDDNAETLLLTERYQPGSFEYRNVLDSRAAYQNMADVQPRVLYSGAVELLPGGRITDLILVTLCLLIGLELIVTERKSAACQLLKPTFRGGIPLIRAKILTAVILLLLGTFILFGTNLLIGLIRCGTFAPDAPVQSVYGFVRSPLKISIGGYLLGFLMLKFLWVVSVCAVVLAVCHMGDDLVSCVLLFLAAIVLLPSGDAESFFSQYRGVNLLGQSIPALTANLLSILLTSASGFTAAIFLHIRRSPISTARSTRKIKTYRICTNLFRYEARKLFLSNGGIWVLMVLTLIQIVSFIRFDPWISPQERLYMHYSETLSGPTDAEKDAFLESEEARFAELYAKLEEYQLAMLSGEMDQEVYQTLTSGIDRQLENESVFLRVQSQYDTMKEMGCDYVCLTGYEQLLGRDGQKDILVLMIQLFLTLILTLSPIHAAEHESGVSLLLNAVPGQKNSERIKAQLASFFALGSSLTILIPHLHKIYVHYGLPGLTAPAASVPMLPIHIGTVWISLAFCGACVSLAGLLVSGLILIISKRTGSTPQTALTTSVLILPILFAYLYV